MQAETMKKRVRRLYIMDYCLTPQKRINGSAILCENERILAIGGASAFAMEPELEIYELTGAYATPGFIDTHIHGAGGFDASVMREDEPGLEAMSRILASRGVTGFVPTMVSLPREEMLENVARLAAMLDRTLPGAQALGIHVEGPFLNPAKRGAQDEKSMCPIDLGYAREIVAAAGGRLRRMTFAPELENADKLVELLCEAGVQPSMGHTIASEEETLRAIDAGARCCTHLFNGMPPLQQRNISITAVALTDNRVTVELIIDGRHIHPRMVDLACRCKPGSKLVAISDGTMASGMPDGRYRIGRQEIVVEQGLSRTGEGTLAGTTTLLDTGWHSLMTYGKTDETYAAGTVSYNAARSLNFTDRGILQPGMRADIAIFEQGSNRLLMTMAGGEIVFRAEGVKPSRLPEMPENES